MSSKMWIHVTIGVIAAALLTGCSDRRGNGGVREVSQSSATGGAPRDCCPGSAGSRAARDGANAPAADIRDAGPGDRPGHAIVPVQGPQHQVTLADIRRAIADGTALILDVRSRESFEAGHIRGAMNLPASEMEQYREMGLGDVDRDQLIIIYCNNRSCHASDMVYEYLLTEGFSNVKVFSPGWESARSL